jgi:hypothetical protein
MPETKPVKMLIRGFRHCTESAPLRGLLSAPTMCERQAALTSNEEACKVLEDMAEEYRKMAEFLQRKAREQERH